MRNRKKYSRVEFFQSSNFHYFFFISRKMYSTDKFLISFPVSFSVYNKKIFYEKKNVVTFLVFKVDAIYGKK